MKKHRLWQLTVFFILTVLGVIHAVEISGNLIGWIDISGPSSIAAGTTATYTCTLFLNDGTTSLTVSPTWSVSSTEFAAVNANGVVTNKNTETTNQWIRLNASYTADGVTKTATKSIMLEGVPATITQTLSLEPGWNWVSFHVLPPSRKIGDTLGTAGFTANDVIQTDGDSARFSGTGWIMEDFTVEFGKLYQIHVDKAVTVTISGDACGQSSISLRSGWNWIGNPTAEAVSLSQLTLSGGWAENDHIQTSGGVSMTYTGNGWISSGHGLEPGKGYQMFMTRNGTLRIPSIHPVTALYVVVDLSGGPNAESYPVRYTNTAPDLNDDACRTTELWLRRIPAGTFIMGSPSEEVGNNFLDMLQHEVTLTQDYYIGVFECTQKQWKLVMGDNPSKYAGDCRPVELVSYDAIRGSSIAGGGGWPLAGHAVDATSFMGKLQEKTGLMFDLPTEAQWEYACRAGTTTALNSGKNLTSTVEDENMAEVGRYDYNLDDGKGGYAEHTKVGCYLPNAWGLYDMHGNVWEWCLDWWSNNGSTEAVVDPLGPQEDMDQHVLCGGGVGLGLAMNCRSASRTAVHPPQSYSFTGFRIAFHPEPKEKLYAVVDLSGGTNAESYPVRYTNAAPDLNDDTCRTTELWLRRIPAGTFVMGSPEDEVGRWDDETQHEVTLTQDYYIGVFECTQKQWELVMGDNPSYFNNSAYYATRPVEKVSYDMIRGTDSQAGAGWPTYGHVVDSSSFMGKLQAKTGLTFDLPTEAQWEHACRAGTTTALNSGKNVTSTEQDANMDEVGRYAYNGASGAWQTCVGTPTDGTAKVGSYLPNAWGLYDMHGNVYEWCLDWCDGNDYSTTPVTDPVGPTSGSYRVWRGGSWFDIVRHCRSAGRDSWYSSAISTYFGFRVACHPEPKQNIYAVVDLSGGPNASNYPVRYTNTEPDLDDDTCRTTELWLRKIPAGTFTMGSPTDEAGREDDETQHEVTLTQDYYIGVFECTQKQWELIMGTKPSCYKGDCRPVECITYEDIRGYRAQEGAGWPTYGHAVDSISFMGKLQAKTGLTFDLPTEAQWEYACRAGTTTALNSGKNLQPNSYYHVSDMDEIARYESNDLDGKGGYSHHTKVGSYLPNAWGLYDMHGNICEWCLDWYKSTYGTTALEDPVGPVAGSSRVIRSGSWDYSANYCRSASRFYGYPTYNDVFFGFRVACLP